MGCTIWTKVALMEAVSDFLMHHCPLGITIMAGKPVMDWIRPKRGRLIWSRKEGLSEDKGLPWCWVSVSPTPGSSVHTSWSQRRPLLVEPHHKLPRWLSGKESAGSAGAPLSIPALGRSPGEGNGNPLQYSCLGNPMDGGTWWATVHGVTKSQTQLSD